MDVKTIEPPSEGLDTSPAPNVVDVVEGNFAKSRCGAGVGVVVVVLNVELDARPRPRSGCHTFLIANGRHRNKPGLSQWVLNSRRWLQKRGRPGGDNAISRQENTRLASARKEGCLILGARSAVGVWRYLVRKEARSFLRRSMMLDSSWMLCWIQNFSGWARNTIRTVPIWAVCKIIRGLHCLLAASQTKKVLPAGVRATFRGNQSASLRSRLLEPDRRRGQLSAILQLHDTTNSPTSRIYQHRCSCLRCSLPDTFSSRKSLAAKVWYGGTIF